jgi:Na+-driven multidrug efflux pump
MICCVVGLLVHIILDIILVEKYTLLGVAISTVASQGVIMILCLVALWDKAPKKIEWRKIPSILLASTSPIGINFVPSVVLLLTNFFALEEGGTAAVSAYAVMSYAIYTFDYIFQGVCDGVQPIISYSVGSGNDSEKLRAMKASGIILAVSSAVFAAMTPLLIIAMPKVFAVSAEAQAMMNTGFIIYAFSYPFKAAVKYIGSYYYAIGRNRISNLLVYSDPLLFTPLLLIILSAAMGMNGVWLSLTLSQVCVTAFGAVSFIIPRKKQTL